MSMKQILHIILILIGTPLKLIFFTLFKIDSLKPYLASTWMQKRAIELGIIKWYDLPHLHSYLIHKRIDMDYYFN